MIPLIGFMVGSYILVRMIELIMKGGHIVTVIAASINLVVTGLLLLILWDESTKIQIGP